MRNLCKKTTCIVLFLILLTTIFATEIFAGDAQNTVADFSNGGNNVICIAHRGDWHSFPENSAEAVNAAIGYDAVSVDIKLTSDNCPILMGDATVDRMCVDAGGKSVTGNVSDFTLAQIKELYLRESNGGTDKNKTDFQVPNLNDIYKTVSGKTALILNVEENDFKTVYDYVRNLGKLNETVFRINANSKKIVSLSKEFSEATVTGNYQGNIIFLATGAVKECFNNSIYTIEMGSTNGNGVLYGNFLMKRFTGNKRAMVSMVNGRCGKRADNETGWDDLISRGYSVIETDYPAELSEYINRSNSVAIELEKFIDLYDGIDLSPYNTKSEKTFNEALTNAKHKLESPSSFSELTDARSALQSAYDSLTVGEKNSVTLKFQFTPGRIITIILCGAAFTIGTLFLRKKRKSV